jgi:hypothetical protein
MGRTRVRTVRGVRAILCTAMLTATLAGVSAAHWDIASAAARQPAGAGIRDQHCNNDPSPDRSRDPNCRPARVAVAAPGHFPGAGHDR